jgi:hypothetical protein
MNIRNAKLYNGMQTESERTLRAWLKFMDYMLVIYIYFILDNDMEGLKEKRINIQLGGRLLRFIVPRSMKR